ncbi:MAG: Fe-S cluster assembly protein SufD, partial [Undibacterium sp.]|nr:Fe-S cluster assembly protein SufD [Opitutaceae bacterium]
MTSLTETKSLVGAFTPEAFAAALAEQSAAPAWWLDRKRAAYEKFAALPMPVRTDEMWRFSSIATLTLAGFTHSPIENPKSKIEDPIPFGPAALTFLNNTLTPSTPTPALPAGVIDTTLTEAAAKH